MSWWETLHLVTWWKRLAISAIKTGQDAPSWIWCTERLSFFGGGHIVLQRFVHVPCHFQPLPTKLVFAYFDRGSYIYIYNISKYTIAFATKFVCKFWLQVHVWKTGPWMLGAKLAAMPWCCFGCKTLQVQVWNRPLNVEGQASSYAYRCCFVGPCVPNFFGIALAQEKMCDTCTCACGCKVPYGSGASRQERTCNSYLLNNGHCNDVIPCDHVHGGASLWSVLKHISKIF